MSLQYILQQVARVAGVTDLSATSAERAVLVDLVNDAAEEIWEERDLPGSLRECYVEVTSNKILAFPSYIGDLKAIRDYDNDRPWELNDLRPRYHHYPWKSYFDNLRHVGESAIIFEHTNTAPLTIKIDVADTDLTVTIVGSTESAARAYDIITMSDIERTGAISFVGIESIQLSKLPDHNVEIYDADGNLVSYILNCAKEARFTVYDISDYPTATGTSYTLEALYKMALPRMFDDNDTFPLPDYDKIIVMKCKQLLAEDDEGKEQRAILMHQKIKGRIDDKVQAKTGTQKANMNFPPNPLLDYFKT